MQVRIPRSGFIECKLNPIINLYSGDVFAFEVKGHVSKGSGDFLERADEHYSSFIRQLEFFQKLNQQDAFLYRMLFVDVSMKFLDSPSAWKEFIPFIFKFRVGACFNMRSVIDELSDVALHNIVKLKGFGVQFWVRVDDERSLVNVPEVYYPYHSYMDGVKIEGAFFESVFNKGDSARLRRIFNVWGSAQTIVDGLDHKDHFAFAVSNGLKLGLGAYCHASWNYQLNGRCI